MNILAAIAVPSMLLASAAAAAENGGKVRITPNASQASAAGPADYFTGAVRVDNPFKTDAPARLGGATVTFEPGARTAWHTHPLGQTLIVIAGKGFVQEWDGAAREIQPGDSVWIPPGVKHWHGAGPTTAMSHVAIAESQDGKVVDWMEKVTDAQYARR